MRVSVPRESAPGEQRVALTPESAAKLQAGGFGVVVERGAGVLAGFTDEQYAEIHAAVMATSPNFYNMNQTIEMNGRLQTR